MEPVDFRKGIDGLAAICRQVLRADPFSGTCFVFGNRTRTAIKVLIYDGQGILALSETAGQKADLNPRQNQKPAVVCY